MNGFIHIPTALLSALVDVFAALTALILAVEILIPKLIYKQRLVLFSFCYAGLLFITGSIIIVSQLALLGQSLVTYKEELEKYQDHFFYWFWADLIFGSYTMVFFISAVGIAVRLAFDRSMESKKVLELEKEKVLDELKFLKDQINPHFIFNALNMIYYSIDHENVRGRETLQRFSDMLRYQLYDCEKPLVKIEDELTFYRVILSYKRKD